GARARRERRALRARAGRRRRLPRRSAPLLRKPGEEARGGLFRRPPLAVALTGRAPLRRPWPWANDERRSRLPRAGSARGYVPSSCIAVMVIARRLG